MSGPTIRTERLRLRPLQPRDVDGPYLGWMNDPEVTRYLESPASHSASELREYVERFGSRPDTWFLAIVTADGAHIGNIKLGPVDVRHRRAEIGIIIGDRDRWGRGYASEAIGAIAERAFAELHLHKLTAGAWATNNGSVKAFERAGFHIEAIRRDHYRSEEGWVDIVLMARFVSGRAPAPPDG